MKKQVNILIGALLFVALLIGATALYSVLSKNANIAPPEAANTPSAVVASDFTMQNSAGEDVTLSSLKGKPIVLNFWASWCPPCKAEMPYFNTVNEELGHEVTFAMVDLVNERETMEDGKAYIAETNFTFPVYFDVGQEAAYRYGISSIPTTLFINAEGHIVSAQQGAISEDVLRQKIELIRTNSTIE